MYDAVISVKSKLHICNGLRLYWRFISVDLSLPNKNGSIPSCKEYLPVSFFVVAYSAKSLF